MTHEELRRLALVGAKERLAVLQQEMTGIYRTFPDLRRGRTSARGNPYTAGVRKAVAGVRGAVEGAVTRRRPTMSAEARKRIAEAQKKRWAEWRAKKSNGTREHGVSKPTQKPRGSAKKR